MFFNRMALAAVFAVTGSIVSSESRIRQNAKPNGAAKVDRLTWFREARFGMFIHWGLYAVSAGEWDGKTDYGEWIMLQAKIPSAEYEKLAARFNPVKFDAREWVRIAKSAGMKYLVVTAKHHDGFSLYDTKHSAYDIVDATPYKRDPMKELAAACREAGITFCFYYSLPDWHHPEFPAKYSQRGFHGAPNPDADLSKYVAYLKAQVRELLTNYGPIGILWFDGGGSFRTVPNRAELIGADEIVKLVRQLQPNCLVNNRLGIPGDYGTPEQHIPGEPPATDFEVCMTLNRHWGYNARDKDWKTPTQVIRNLADIASKGGNYLLNVGPTAEGVIPPESVRILEEVGKWLARNGESIYETSASPLPLQPAWGRITRKGKRLYLHVFDWPSDRSLTVHGLHEAPGSAHLLSDASGARLPITKSENGFRITVPEKAPDSANSVITLDLP